MSQQQYGLVLLDFGHNSTSLSMADVEILEKIY
jgi:hypothetical protein